MQFNLSESQATMVFWILGISITLMPLTTRFLNQEEQMAILAAIALTKSMIGKRAYSLTPAGNVADNPPTKAQVEGMENAAAAKGKNLDGSDKF